MLSEFSDVQDQLKLLFEERSSLLDTLRQLEAANIETETSVIPDGEYQLTKHVCSSSGPGKYSEWSTTESSDDIEKHELGEVSDEDEASFYDTKEYFAEVSATNGSLSEVADHTREPNQFDNEEKMHTEKQSCNSGNPLIVRREKLPDPVEGEKGISLWSLIKDNVGKDLTRVCLPVYFNEPISSLQKCFEDLEYSYLLDQAYEHGKAVSHHPTIIACHCEGGGWKFSGDSNLRSKFWGQTIQLEPVGVLTLEFDDGEIFQWSKVTSTIHNLIIGKVYCNHHGKMYIRGNRQHSCKLKFKELSILDRNPHQVNGFVEDVLGNRVATLYGKWDDSMYYSIGDKTTKPEDATLLWKRTKPPSNLTRYNLTSFAITLNELTPGLQEKLPPTDSRLRPDQRHLENGEYEKANAEKQRLEKRQRMSRKLQEHGWRPRWFQQEGENGPFKYVGGYWEAREQGNWDGCPNIFGEFNEEIVQSSEMS